jgi:hypothetical protein
MRTLGVLALIIGLALVVNWFGPNSGNRDPDADDWVDAQDKEEEARGPTVPTFTGRLLHRGEPVRFEGGEQVVLRLVHRGRVESFGIPIRPDGTFELGWMPLGEYAAYYDRGAQERGANPFTGGYQLPSDLNIREGQTDYTIELGEDWTP